MEIVKLDKLDEKILLVLLQNSRVSIIELAKLVNNNYPTVRNRMNRLVEKGVIPLFKTNVWYSKLGIPIPLSIYMTVKSITPEQEEAISKELSKNPFITTILKLEGKWDYFIQVLAPNSSIQKSAVNQIQNIFGENLKDISVLITTSVKHANRQFFTDLKINIDSMKTGYNPLLQENLNKKPSPEPLKLSKEDIKILNHMGENARDTLEEISEATGVPPNLVDYRIKRMVSQNLIRYFLISINEEILGYERYILFLNCRGNNEMQKAIIEYLHNTKGSIHFSTYLSYWEISFTFCVKNREEMHKIFSNLLNKFPGAIKDHELVWAVRWLYAAPYPDVNKIISAKENK